MGKKSRRRKRRQPRRAGTARPLRTSGAKAGAAAGSPAISPQPGRAATAAPAKAPSEIIAKAPQETPNEMIAEVPQETPDEMIDKAPQEMVAMVAEAPQETIADVPQKTIADVPQKTIAAAPQETITDATKEVRKETIAPAAEAKPPRASAEVARALATEAPHAQPAGPALASTASSPDAEQVASDDDQQDPQTRPDGAKRKGFLIGLLLPPPAVAIALFVLAHAVTPPLDLSLIDSLRLTYLFTALPALVTWMGLSRGAAYRMVANRGGVSRALMASATAGALACAGLALIAAIPMGLLHIELWRYVEVAAAGAIAGVFAGAGTGLWAAWPAYRQRLTRRRWGAAPEGLDRSADGAAQGAEEAWPALADGTMEQDPITDAVTGDDAESGGSHQRPPTRPVPSSKRGGVSAGVSSGY